MIRKEIYVIIFLFIVTYVSAEDLYGDIDTHDPSTIIKDEDTYWNFATGDGVGMRCESSDDLITWSSGGYQVVPTIPGWVDDYVPDFNGHYWAPDIIYMNNAYYLYYSCSKWGTTNSAIGLTISSSLNSPYWEDQGMVVYSDGTAGAINAIDPGLFKDTDGKVYMTYGSWFGGIGIVEIDTVTGKAVNSVTHVYGGGHQSIEAPYLFKEGDYYYLVVNRGTCCDGINSTYYITVGLSDDIYGPYDGFKDLLAADGKYIGPGHFALLRDGCKNYVSIHYYDGSQYGWPKLDILKMTMDKNYPVLTRDFNFSDPCDEVNITSAKTENHISIFPNPCNKELLSIEIKGQYLNKDMYVFILSTDGRITYSRSFDFSKLINIYPELEKGIYLIKIEIGENTFTKKLIVQ